jgi:hypothetical protein
MNEWTYRQGSPSWWTLSPPGCLHLPGSSRPPGNAGLPSDAIRIAPFLRQVRLADEPLGLRSFDSWQAERRCKCGQSSLPFAVISHIDGVDCSLNDGITSHRGESGIRFGYQLITWSKSTWLVHKCRDRKSHTERCWRRAVHPSRNGWNREPGLEFRCQPGVLESGQCDKAGTDVAGTLGEQHRREPLNGVTEPSCNAPTSIGATSRRSRRKGRPRRLVVNRRPDGS